MLICDLYSKLYYIYIIPIFNILLYVFLSDCIPLTTNTPCCGNISVPGKVNPKTKRCEILCKCGGINSLITGVMVILYLKIEANLEATPSDSSSSLSSLLLSSFSYRNILLLCSMNTFFTSYSDRSQHYYDVFIYTVS